MSLAIMTMTRWATARGVSMRAPDGGTLAQPKILSKNVRHSVLSKAGRWLRVTKTNVSFSNGAPGLRWCTRARLQWFGVVRPRDIKYRVHMCPSLDDPLLLRLNTDVWEYM